MGRVPRYEPLAAPSATKRLAAKVAESNTAVRAAGLYLEHVVSRIEPLLNRWSGGRLTSLPIAPIVFLHATGAKTGERRVTPLTYFTDGNDVILVASNYGRSTNPAWYRNVKSHPEVVLRAGAYESRYVVHEASGKERDHLWALAVQCFAPLPKYQSMAGTRRIPILRCVPVDSGR